jgi:ABC-type phosphate transport system substrate-binding protein
MHFNLTRGTALALSAVLLGGTAAIAGPRPGTILRPATRTLPFGAGSGGTSEQVLSEGGTLAAYVFGNLADFEGKPIQGPNTASKGRDQQKKGEILYPNTPDTNPQYNYAPTGSGTASYDFVVQLSGGKGKNISQAYPFTLDGVDNWKGEAANGTLATTGPFGFTPWAGTGASTVPSDSLHWAAGDAPLPLGDPVNKAYNGNGKEYANSLAAFNAGGSPPAIGQGNPGGFNPQRGPAVVVPVIGTGVATVINTTNLVFKTTPSLTQDDLCGIYTGTIRDWNETYVGRTGALKFAAGKKGQPITIVHRSDGSGTTFLLSYTLSKMCSAANPKKLVSASHYYGGAGGAGRTQGVGTDSNNYVETGNRGIPVDNGAPEVVWPFSSLGASGNSGVMNCINNQNGIASYGTTTINCAGLAGLVGYVSPSLTSQVIPGTSAEAYVQNYTGQFEPANSTTVQTALDGSTVSANGPAGYPQDPHLYFPFPSTNNSAPIVGYTYGYFYQCSALRLADQVSAIATLFKYLETPDTIKGITYIPASDHILQRWNLTPMPDALKTAAESAIAGTAATASASGTYHSPVDGTTKSFTCTPV